MPIPTGFDNLVRRVTATPVTAADINTEISTQNGAGYWMTSLIFTNADNVFMLFAKNLSGFTWPQKVNIVAQTQAALDADKATEEANGNYPTGVFATPGGDLIVFYQALVSLH
jgi:hypothetical protein